MTDEEREEILEQAFRNISVPREVKENHGSDLDQDPLEAWARNMPPPEPAPPVRKLDTRRQELQPSIYQWIEERLETERKFILEVAAQAIGEMLEEQHKIAKSALQDEVRQLRIELCELQTTLCELRQVIAKERKTLDLPSQLTARTVN
jgi:hypothetical protein